VAKLIPPALAQAIQAMPKYPYHLRATRSVRDLVPEEMLASHEMMMSLGEKRKRPATGHAFDIGKAELIELAQQPDGFNPIHALLGEKWNVWGQGRFTGSNDALAASSSLGFNASAGADYRLLPWMLAGLSVGVESNEMKQAFAGARTGAVGVSATPYLGFRLDSNLFAAAFAGVTALSYNSNPQAGISASYTGTRAFVGGSLTGSWRDGPWRFEPGISILYGVESLAGYTDSAGTFVPTITPQAGRVSVGPEIGRTWVDPDGGWRIEPYLRAKLNLDYIDNRQVFLNGELVGTRGSASGAMGGGLTYVGAGGTSARVEASYDSIGVQGLDAWSATMRIGWSF